MNTRDLMKAWDEAVDEATIEQKRDDETDTTLKARSGLRTGFAPSGEFLHGAPWNGAIGNC